MGRFRRSWKLAGDSLAVLRKDKELLVLPLISGIALTVIVVSFVFGMGLHRAGQVEQLSLTRGDR